MSPVRVTFARTVGRLRHQLSTAFAAGLFLSVTAVLFSFGLQRAEGGHLSVAAVWAAAVSPVLPALAAFLAMDVWSDERQTGRIDLLLTAAVRERDYVLGKFLGVWVCLLGLVLVSLAATACLLLRYAPSTLVHAVEWDFSLAFFVLALQGALWCAVSVAASAMFHHAAAAAVASVVVTIALPRGLWFAMLAWSDVGRATFGEMPIDAHAVDFASGMVSSGVLVAYLMLAAMCLFVACKAVASLRLVGRGARFLRFSTAASVVLSFVFSALAIMLAARLDVQIDLPFSGTSASFSPRTRSVLSEIGGELTVTCFLSRGDSRFRPVGRFLRQLRREAESAGASRVAVRFVDPRWDLGSAERLVRRGVEEGSVVFEHGRRFAVMPLSEGYGEHACASTLRRLMTPFARRNIYWTKGHGENAFDAYGAFGMSDIARDLAREGYRNMSLDLMAGKEVTNDCALVVVSGARNDFSRVELGRLDAYLHSGGRLLVLVSTPLEGLSSVLAAWGIRLGDAPPITDKTISGTDVVVSDFSRHEISAPLKGERIVLERPLSFTPSAAAEGGKGADRISFTPVASAGGAALAVAAERGAGAGSDLAIRPTRIVAVGDASFAMNGALAARANANRDFFLNCIAFLAGTDASGSSGAELGMLAANMDRLARRRHFVWSAAVLPAAVFLLLVVAALLKRRRS